MCVSSCLVYGEAVHEQVDQLSWDWSAIAWQLNQRFHILKSFNCLFFTPEYLA